MDTPVTYLTDKAYPAGWPMGLLAGTGILRVGDVPHLAFVRGAPRRLIIAGGTTADGRKLRVTQLDESFAFPRVMYRLSKGQNNLTVPTR